MSRSHLSRREFMGRSLAVAGVGAGFAIGGTKSSGRIIGANDKARGEVMVVLNAALVAAVRPPPVACRVYPFPALSMLRLEKVATPLAAVTVCVPESAPPLGFVPNATVTAPVKLGSVLPALSFADT